MGLTEGYKSSEVNVNTEQRWEEEVHGPQQFEMRRPVELSTAADLRELGPGR